MNEQLVLNDSVGRITYVLRNIKYGLLILSAPAGSGLMNALQKMTSRRHMKIFKGAYLLDFNKILSSFGIPDYAKLSSYLP